MLNEHTIWIEPRGNSFYLVGASAVIAAVKAMAGKDTISVAQMRRLDAMGFSVKSTLQNDKVRRALLSAPLPASERPNSAYSRGLYQKV